VIELVSGYSFWFKGTAEVPPVEAQVGEITIQPQEVNIQTQNTTIQTQGTTVQTRETVVQRVETKPEVIKILGLPWWAVLLLLVLSGGLVFGLVLSRGE